MSTVQRKKSKIANALTDEESKYLIETCEKLTNDQKRDFLRSLELAHSGNKEELVERIKDGLKSGAVPVDSLLLELDRILPWWRFHVFLYAAPPLAPKLWRKKETVEKHLDEHGVLELLNAQIPLVLPEKLTLTSIYYSPERLRITAVQRREYTEHHEELDLDDETVNTILQSRNAILKKPRNSAGSDGDIPFNNENGSAESIEYRAFVRQVARGLVSLEWDFVANTAMIQITELPRGSKYETVRDAFFALIKSWFTLKDFHLVDVSKAIAALHESEKNDEGEVRSHGIEYRTIAGRRLAARSQATTTSVLGEDVIDDSLDRIRKDGVGHSGNFYWLPTEDGDGSATELEREIHVVILGDKKRVSLRTRSTTNVTEKEMRHVLSRLRELSQ